MKKLPVWCTEVLTSITILCLVAQSTFAMATLGAENDYLPYRQVSKRQHHDPWDLCPPEMPSVDCFYVYLSVYARLRREGANQAPDRMVGKRGLENSFRSLDTYSPQSSRSFNSYTPPRSRSLSTYKPSSRSLSTYKPSSRSSTVQTRQPRPVSTRSVLDVLLELEDIRSRF